MLNTFSIYVKEKESEAAWAKMKNTEWLKGGKVISMNFCS